jgi:hypothetical protein
LVVLAIIVGVYYFGTKNKLPVTPITSVQPSSTPVVISTLDPATKNWKTFKGNVFSYQYPADLSIINLPSSNVSCESAFGDKLMAKEFCLGKSVGDNRAFYQDKISADQAYECDKKPKAPPSPPDVAPSCGYSLMTISITEIYDINYDTKKDFSEPVEFTTTSGIKMTKENRSGSATGYDSNLNAYVNTGKKLYHIEIQTTPVKSYGSWQLLNQILSTFKFIN